MLVHSTILDFLKNYSYNKAINLKPTKKLPKTLYRAIEIDHTFALSGMFFTAYVYSPSSAEQFKKNSPGSA